MGRRRWIVDGNNVMGSRPDGWWRDRTAAATRLAGQLVNMERPEGVVLVVVFDGPDQRPPDRSPPSGLDIRYAGSTGTADDVIVELVAADPGWETTVFTSDAELSRRVQALGAEVSGARSLLGRLH